MADKQGSSHHRKQGGEQQGQQQRGRMSHGDRRNESGRTGGESPRQDEDPGRRSHMEREKADKGQGGPA